MQSSSGIWPPEMKSRRSGILPWASIAETTSSATVSPDSRLVLTGDDEGTLRIYDLETGNRLKAIAPPPSAAPSKVASVAFSSDGHLVLAGREDGSITLLDLRDEKSLRTL